MARSFTHLLTASLACAALCACGERVTVSRIIVSGLSDGPGARPAGQKTRELVAREVDRARGYTLAGDGHKDGWTLKVDLHRVADAAVARELGEGDLPAVEVKLQRYDQKMALDSYAAAVALKPDDVKVLQTGGVSEERVAALVGEGLTLLRSQMDFRKMDAQALLGELAGKEAWRREFAVEELGRRADPASSTALVLKLKDPEKAVALKAVGALVALGDPSVVPSLIDYAKGKDPATQIQMIFAISQLGGRMAEGYLFVLAGGHADPQIAHAAKEAFDELQGRKGKGALRRNRVRLAALCAAAALALAACAAPSAESGGAGGPTAAVAKYSKEEIARYYPLAVGNTWLYKGALLNQPVQNRVTITRVDGAVYADDKGGQLLVDDEGLRDRKRYLLKGPIKKGVTWMSVASIASVERFEIVEAGRLVKVGAGSFDGCVIVRGKNKIDAHKDFVTEWTYAPGVGIVRIETFLLKEGKDYVPQGQLELSAYELRKDAP